MNIFSFLLFYFILLENLINPPNITSLSKLYISTIRALTTLLSIS